VVHQSRKFALVIGNGAYLGELKLDSPPLDAAKMATCLKDLDFQVTSGVNLGFDAMNALLDGFIANLRTSSWTAPFG
jgi:uncharacterized caspase-like protein